VPPSVHVIVDQLPAAPSWPVWETTLFAAMVGAIFGILGNAAMEYLKPWIAKHLKRKMRRHFAEEVSDNLGRLLSANTRLKSALDLSEEQRAETEKVVRQIRDNFRREAFDRYAVDERDALLELKGHLDLYAFYNSIRSTPPADYSELFTHMHGVNLFLTSYAKTHGIKLPQE